MTVSPSPPPVIAQGETNYSNASLDAAIGSLPSVAELVRRAGIGSGDGETDVAVAEERLFVQSGLLVEITDET